MISKICGQYVKIEVSDVKFELPKEKNNKRFLVTLECVVDTVMDIDYTRAGFICDDIYRFINDEK